MRWSSGVSAQPDTAIAVGEAAEAVLRGLGGLQPDLVLAFLSAQHAEAWTDVPALVAQRLPRALLVGCSAGAVLGAGVELEQRPGVALVAAVLPGVELRPFHLEAEQIPPLDAGPPAWLERLGLRASDGVPDPPLEETHFVLLPDPFSIEVDVLLASLDAAFPRGAKVGGLASGGQRPGSHALWLSGRTVRSGAVGVALRGNVTVDTLVSQGCRPIGPPLLVTRCEKHFVLELDGKSPVVALTEIAAGLDERDRELFRHTLSMGIEIRDQEEYGPGDFLIRQIVGLDPERGALAVATVPHPWQVVQFHIRDGNSSAEELSRRLDRYQRDHVEEMPAGALLFSCVGRGLQLYGRGNHDSELFASYLPGVPLGGFFSNGEIGPGPVWSKDGKVAGGASYLHGFTSSFGLFRPRGRPVGPSSR